MFAISKASLYKKVNCNEPFPLMRVLYKKNSGRLGWKGLPGTNALAYLTHSTVRKEKNLCHWQCQC